MKILVATKETQGKRKNDFCFVDEGEIVMFPSIEDGEGRRCMVGVKSHKGTTTMKVVERSDIDVTQLKIILLNSLVSAGFCKVDDIKLQEIAEGDSKILLQIANDFPVGAILERAGNRWMKRV